MIYNDSEWELQKIKVKELFGHNDACPIEQYINALIQRAEEYEIIKIHIKLDILFEKEILK